MVVARGTPHPRDCKILTLKYFTVVIGRAFTKKTKAQEAILPNPYIACPHRGAISTCINFGWNASTVFHKTNACIAADNGLALYAHSG